MAEGCGATNKKALASNGTCGLMAYLIAVTNAFPNDMQEADQAGWGLGGGLSFPDLGFNWAESADKQSTSGACSPVLTFLCVFTTHQRMLMTTCRS